MQGPLFEVRPATRSDAVAIATIYNEGIADRVATFRTEPRTAADVEGMMERGGPWLVAERPAGVIGWAAVGPYDDSAPYYAGIGEAAVYVAREARGAGAGRTLLTRLEPAAAGAGYFKLVAKVFDTNEPSLRLFAAAGWRTVGVHRRHGRLEGAWKDVVLFEQELDQAPRPGS